MKKFLFVILMTFISQTVFCQICQQSVGIRGGYSSGFEYRVHNSSNLAYRVLLSSVSRGLQLTGLKEFHQSGLFNFSKELVFIYGFGAHLGYERWKADEPYLQEHRSYYSENRTGLVIGLDGLTGIEYMLNEIPLIFGLEIKPYFNLFGRNFFQIHPFDIALTIKYCFHKKLNK